MNQLDLRLLGPFQATLNGQSLAESVAGKLRALLAYMAVEPRPHHRETLAGLLWSDQPNERALHSLRQALSSLRRILGEETTNSLLLIRGDTLQLDCSANGCTLDVQQFQEKLALAQCQYARRSAPGRLNVRALQQAVALYRGPFLDQLIVSGGPLFDEWNTMCREALGRQAVAALALLAEYYERRGEYTLARQSWNRVLEITPYEETAQRELMRLLACDGQWSAAQSQFFSCRQYLADQLGLAPAQETQALFEQVRRAAAHNQPLPPRFAPVPNTLPAIPFPMIGRAPELDALAAALADPACRLLTLLGPGGIGKTRLALEAAHSQRGLFADGVYFVPLATLDSSELLAPAIASALGFQFFGSGALAAQLTDTLRPRRALLVLDNFEHLIETHRPQTCCEGPGMDMLVEWLEQAPGVTFLVTSRAPLNLRVECILEVDGLPTPPAGAAADPRIHSAVALFDQAARRMHPRFALEAELADVAHICRLLSGVPLAIELAAAWVRGAACAQIAQQIETDMGWLVTTMRDVPARHRSLRAVFEHSWALLTPEQQQVFMKLSVFRGGFAAASAAQVAGADAAALQALIKQSLLRSLAGGRCELHPLVRQFAAEKLGSASHPVEGSASHPVEGSAPPLRRTLGVSHPAETTRAAHAVHFAGFLAVRQPALKSAGQKQALQEIATEIENVRFAWQTMAAPTGSARFVESVAACSDALFQFYNIRSLFDEGLAAFECMARTLNGLAGAELTAARVWVRYGALALRLKKTALAQQALQESRPVFERLGERAELAACLIWLGWAIQRTQGRAAADELARQGLAICEEIGDLWGQAYARYMLGLNASYRGETEPARQWLLASLEACRQAGDQRRMIGPLNTLGDLACYQGDFEAARVWFEQSLAISQDLGDRFNAAMLLMNLGTTDYSRANYSAAAKCYRASLEIAREIGDRAGEGMCLSNLGEVDLVLGELTTAEELFQHALQLAQTLGDDYMLAINLNNLGLTALRRGAQNEALACFRRGLQAAEEAQLSPVLMKILVSMGELFVESGDAVTAVQLLVFTAHDPVCEQENQQRAARALAVLEPRLPPGQFAALRQCGLALTLESALELARLRQD